MSLTSAVKHGAPLLAKADPHRGSMPSTCVTSNTASPPPAPQILNKLPGLPLSRGKYYYPFSKKKKKKPSEGNVLSNDRAHVNYIIVMVCKSSSP